MGTATGIEIGPDACVLVALRPRRGGPAEVRAFHAIERSEWPPTGSALVAALTALRRSRRLPRRARVVSWRAPDGTGLHDPAADAAVRPLAAAGFRVEAILSPPEALARLAASRPREGAVVWLALNVHGAAIAIVRGESLLFSRTFSWTYVTDLAGTRAQLLQRYSLVSQLAPEIRRGLASVRLEYDAAVSTVITCGDLPELRSLTMPLIEELDLEVETLDSTEGLKAVGRARMERFAESAPMLRLACAAALAPVEGGRAVVWRRAAVAAVAAGAVGGAVLLWRARTPEHARSSGVIGQPTAAQPAAARPTAPAVPKAAAPVPQAAAAPIPQAAAVPAARMPATASAPAAVPPAPPVPRPAAHVPAGAPASSGTAASSAAASSATPRPATAPRSAAAPAPAPAPPAPAPAPRPAAAAGSGLAPAGSPPPHDTAASRSRRTLPPVPLKDPLPRVDSILIDQARRLAIVNGAVVSAGDSVGPRLVLAINPDGIVLREPSGVEVKVPLRPSAGGP